MVRARTAALLMCGLALAACQARAPRVMAPPLAGTDEGELYVYLQPLPAGFERLELTLASVAAVGEGGAEMPLEVGTRAVSGRNAPRDQRLLATGVVPAGAYQALLLHVVRATLGAGDGAADLLVPEEPIRVEIPFAVRARGGRVLWVSIRPSAAGAGQYRFDAALTAEPARAAASDVVSYAALPARDAVIAFDKRARQVFGLLHAAGEPRGIAIDGEGRRAYVALSGADEVVVFDSAAGEEVARIPLRPADAPLDLALVDDGRTLVALNAGSRSVAFLETDARLEVARVPVGDGATALVPNRTRTRVFVLTARPATITVLDVASRSTVLTAALEAEPVWVDGDRDGRRLYVAERGSPFLSVLTLPDLAPAGRVFIGLGVTYVKVDPRTDLVYLSRADASWLDVLDPLSQMVLDRIDLPGPAAAVHLDDAQNALFATIPSLAAIAVVDLTSQRLLGLVRTGSPPEDVAFPGER